MVTTFKNIPHVGRKVFARTSMNEILVFFTYTPISLVNNQEALTRVLKEMELTMSRLQLNSNGEKDDLVEYQDQLKQTQDKGIFVVESDDRTCVFTCRYGFEKYGEQDALSLKTMISSQSYNVKGLTRQVMEMNELMFDVWHWAMSPAILKFMDTSKEQ